MGLGAVLVQTKNGESRVICYASRIRSDVERRYAQTEKEALALVWASEHFHVCLWHRIWRRSVIPINLRQRVLQIAHEGHPGIVTMKSRTKVWWPELIKQ